MLSSWWNNSAFRWNDLHAPLEKGRSICKLTSLSDLSLSIPTLVPVGLTLLAFWSLLVFQGTWPNMTKSWFWIYYQTMINHSGLQLQSFIETGEGQSQVRKTTLKTRLTQRNWVIWVWRIQRRDQQKKCLGTTITIYRTYGLWWIYAWIIEYH